MKRIFIFFVVLCFYVQCFAQIAIFDVNNNINDTKLKIQDSIAYCKVRTAALESSYYQLMIKNGVIKLDFQSATNITSATYNAVSAKEVQASKLKEITKIEYEGILAGKLKTYFPEKNDVQSKMSNSDNKNVSQTPQMEFRDREGEYKSFLDLALSTTVINKESFITAGLTTSHGVQLSPAFFIGVGTGLNVSTNSKTAKKQISVPVFGQLRFNLNDNVISPYIDAKVGYMGINNKGFFAEPSVGVSMPISSGFAIDCGLAYNFLKSEQKKHNIALKFGFEF